jgi:hypothetical protein
MIKKRITTQPFDLKSSKYLKRLYFILSGNRELSWMPERACPAPDTGQA